MTMTWERGLPRKLLLATDMSARCDRAFDRAVELAQLWGAHLHVIRVLEESNLVPKPARDRELVRARADLGREVETALRGRNVDYAVEVVAGDPPAVLLETANRLGCELIVAGSGRYDRLSEVLFGSTVDKVIRRSPCPVLMVNARPHGPYGSILVAVECSEASRRALDCALSLFPEARTTVINAHPVSSLSLASLVAPSADRARIHQDHERAVSAFVEETKRRRAAAGLPGTVADIVVSEGGTETVVQNYIETHRPDLVVMGTIGRTGMLNTAIGNTVERITAITSCDVLAVRSED